MTRETRVGLLVGMVFIVAFGLILSELTVTTSSGTASESAGDIKEVASPGWAPLIAPPRVIQSETEPIAVAHAEPPVEQMRVAEVSMQRQPRPEAQPIALIALSRQGTRNPNRAANTVMVRKRLSRPRTYTVKEGDSLRRIARNVYGRGYEERYMEIFRANQKTLSDPSKVYVGQELIIPNLQQQVAAAPAAAQAAPVAPAQPRQVRLESPAPRIMDLEQLKERFGFGGSVDKPSPAATRATSKRVYVVRAGDNLTRIARREMNDGSDRAVQKLYQVNRDKLSSPDMLSVGVELRIPGQL